MKNYSKGEIAKIILMALAAGGLLFVLAACPGFAYIFKLFPAKNWKERGRIRRAVRRLEEKKFVRTIATKNGNALVITRRGLRELKRYRVNDIKKLPRNKKWDGRWRLIIFDIPEGRKKVRNAMSRKLKELGCYPLQRSAFLYPYDCRQEIEFIGDFFNVRNNIRYITSDDADIDHKALTFFNVRRI